MDALLINFEQVHELSAALGPRRLGALLKVLHDRLSAMSARLASETPDAQRLGDELHQSRGSAATLGLLALEQGIDTLEAEVKIGAAQALVPATQIDGWRVAMDALLQCLAESVWVLQQQIPGLEFDHAPGS